jgi:hypothetical protein
LSSSALAIGSFSLELVGGSPTVSLTESALQAMSDSLVFSDDFFIKPIRLISVFLE